MEELRCLRCKLRILVLNDSSLCPPCRTKLICLRAENILRTMPLSETEREAQWNVLSSRRTRSLFLDRAPTFTFASYPAPYANNTATILYADTDTIMYDGPPGMSKSGSCSPQALASQPIAEEHISKLALCHKTGQECVICLDDAKTHCILPCMHMCLCEACSKHEFDNGCPICRGPIEAIKLIYL